ncbi:threonylcarbamoyl-AMP synthase [Marinococcus halophilus]|uniref:Threonylcarbamoyl-AMP synthase n=1 Tax=Marinococcus halophilus TaxID=1371 RepID=A0A510Y7D9_MARHA|nr:L-threonylcarbamoyladenylate synthase [Marinococcus halophilus]OZT81849.1 threonylcarbamoyl-AMP synthase [Marinococcus halophilus]GEK59282.1 threonylcarbamoyl-AMP synthase [Marinococcus halophilus]
MSYKQTVIRNVDNISGEIPEKSVLKEMGLWIKQGKTVALPTETVYGLGASAVCTEAVRAIFKAKNRPPDNPLIAHIADRAQLDALGVTWTENMKKLMDTFWPGPLTLIFPLTKETPLSSLVTAGLPTVAVRIPEHEVARALLTYAGVPVAAPSANRSGSPSPTTAEHVYNDLSGKIDAVIDGGACGYGVESTVVDCTTEVCWILRPGGVTKEQLERVLGPGTVRYSHSASSEESPAAPGMKYRHYSPATPLYLMEGPEEMWQNRLRAYQQEGKKVAVLAVEENKPAWKQADAFFSLGSRRAPEETAAKLYAVLRELDTIDADAAFCEVFAKEGIGAALMNRLEKAASSEA